MERQVKSFWVKIYLSGDIDVIKQVCRKYCSTIGLCVTVNDTLFIYKGGEEYGVEIGLLNYPKFIDTEENIISKALILADKCRAESYQSSYLIMTPETIIWYTNE